MSDHIAEIESCDGEILSVPPLPPHAISKYEPSDFHPNKTKIQPPEKEFDKKTIEIISDGFKAMQPNNLIGELTAMGLTPSQAVECIAKYGETDVTAAVRHVKELIEEGEPSPPGFLLVQTLQVMRKSAPRSLADVYRDTLLKRLAGGATVTQAEYDSLPLETRATLEYSQLTLEKTGDLVYYDPQTWRGI
jgi:hypothetical protein